MKENQLLLLVSFFLFLNIDTQAQKYFTRDGQISFFSKTDVEDIEAKNYKVVAVYDIASGSIEFSALMKAFEFKKALMQEHFNENYVESDKYPKAVFKGKVENFSSAELSKFGEYPVSVIGELTMHGVTKSISAPGKITVTKSGLEAVSEFVVKLADYEIQIPKLVESNIAKSIKVDVKVILQELKK